MPKTIEITETEAHQYAFSIGQDAGEKSRRENQRDAWNDEDLNAAAKASNVFLSKLGFIPS